MRIPTDKPLAKWIRELIKADKVYLFYQTKEWKELRREVLEDNHYECAECVKKGKYTRADCVHHNMEVKTHPHLALSKWYTNPTTEETERNLIPLCNDCHNLIHDKLGNWQRKDKFTNKERW